MRLVWKPKVGNKKKVATNGPIAAPAVLSNAVSPALFIRSPTRAWTSAAMSGKRVPETTATGNIRATHRTATCHQRRSNTPVGARINSPGKSKYESSTKIAAASNRIASIGFERRDIQPQEAKPNHFECQKN